MVLELVKAAFLGLVQGVTEFLPVSSTGHLIIAEKLLGISQETYGLAFDAALHMGTLVAIIWFFKKEWVMIGTSVLRIIKAKKIETQNERLFLLLLVGTIPAAIIGFLLEDFIDTTFRSPLLVGVALILFSFVLLYVEKVGHKTQKMEKLGIVGAVIVGLAQSIALIPGVSRSGITIAAGMWRGLTRSEAAKFTFLLSAPIIAGAGGKKVLETTSLFMKGTLGKPELMFFAVGMVTAAICGYLTIKYFLRFLGRNSLNIFIAYRLFLGFLIVIFYAGV